MLVLDFRFVLIASCLLLQFALLADPATLWAFSCLYPRLAPMSTREVCHIPGTEVIDAWEMPRGAGTGASVLVTAEQSPLPLYSLLSTPGS